MCICVNRPWARCATTRRAPARQYALKDRALNLGWQSDQIRVLDRDLGLSGTQTNNRQDFKTLVADVSLEKVGAVCRRDNLPVFPIEAGNKGDCGSFSKPLALRYWSRSMTP
jgi:hypothetical protein